MAIKGTELIDEIKSKFKANGIIQREQRIWITTDANKLMEMCTWLKDHGFIHLSMISVTDWLKDRNYEVTYHLWSYNDKILVTIKTKIGRENPVISSVTSIWGENAQIHERELHELFGVKFEGNLNLSPLFLEDWENMPPFRKDFEWREYVREKFYDKKNEREKVYYD
jgi:NADH-quinone oxidoreductase subunit C